MFELITLVTLLVLGFFCGRIAERKHYKSISEREAKCLNVPAVTFSQPLDDRGIASIGLVSSGVVVSVDYFKRFLTGFRMFFGGELKSYSSLIDRGRREAILRMREQAPDADAFYNVRLETSSISKGKKDAVGTIEVLAYATAVTYRDEIHAQTTD